MSEDAPLEPVAPEPVTMPTEPVATESVPTEPVATTTPPPPGPPPWSSPAAASDGRPPRGSSVAVPKWLLLVVGALVIAGLGFVVGWVAAPGGGHDERRAAGPNSGFLPSPFANGGNGPNGGGSGNRQTNPAPAPRRSGAFLGVATTRSANPAGVRVARVVPGAPAAAAGLKVDDVITKVDGDSVTRPEQLAASIGAHQSGDRVTITYVRGGTTDTAQVTLARRSSIQIPTPTTVPPRL